MTKRKNKRQDRPSLSNKEKSKRPRYKSFTFSEKQELVKKFNDSSMNQLLFASSHGIPATTFGRWLRCQTSINEQGANESVRKDSKRNRPPKYPALESALFRWFETLRHAGSTITDEILKTKAQSLATSPQSGVTTPNWMPSNGFIYRFKSRHGIRSYSQTGELSSANETDAESERLQIQSLIAETPYDLFLNQDETGLYWKCLPTKSLSATQTNRGAKRSKDRLTVAIYSSSDGSIFEPFVIGKSANPRCFRGPDGSNIPLRDRYMSSRKAWMTMELCRSMIQKFQAILEIRVPGATSLTFWDNAASHPPELDPQNGHCFFAPNLTSLVQPNDQGIIAAFKLAYRREFLQRLIQEVEQTILEYRTEGRDIPRDLATQVANKFTIKDALECIQIASSYMRRNPSIMQNCWLKAGILPLATAAMPPNASSGSSSSSSSTSTSSSSSTSSSGSSSTFSSTSSFLPTTSLLDDLSSSNSENSDDSIDSPFRRLANEVDGLLNVIPQNERLSLREYLELDSDLQTEKAPVILDDPDDMRWFHEIIQEISSDSDSDSCLEVFENPLIPPPSCKEVIGAIECLLRLEGLDPDLKTRLLSLKSETSQKHDRLLRQSRIDEFFTGIPTDF